MPGAPAASVRTRLLGANRRHPPPPQFGIFQWENDGSQKRMARKSASLLRRWWGPRRHGSHACFCSLPAPARCVCWRAHVPMCQGSFLYGCRYERLPGRVAELRAQLQRRRGQQGDDGEAAGGAAVEQKAEPVAVA